MLQVAIDTCSRRANDSCQEYFDCYWLENHL